MSWLSFAGGNLIVFLTAFFLLRRRGLAPAEGCLALFTLACGQIIFTMLLAGTMLRLAVNTVLVLNLFFLAAAILPGRLFTGPARTARPQSIRPDASWHLNFWARLLLFLAFLETTWLLFLGYLFPPYAWDSLYYHLTAVATWLQAGRIVLSPYTIWANVYPMNTELIFAWNMLLSGSDMLVDLTQLPFALAGSLAVYALGREMGLRQANSAVAACLFFLTPIVLVQSKTCYVDVAFAAMFLVAYFFAYRYYHCPRRLYLLLAALASGLAFGMKASAAPFVVTVFALVLAGSRRASLSSVSRPLRHYLILSLAVFTLALLLGGSYWYLRNWLAYGNPLFPFTFKVLGYTLWPGQGTVTDLVMVKNTPPELAGLPAWQQLLRSWQETGEPYTFDQRLGGFGPQWLYLELPALAVTLMLAVVRGRQRLLLPLLPLVLLFWLQPARWWTRYTIFLVAAGTLSLAYLEEKLPRFWARPWRAATLALVLISLAGSLTHGYFTPRVIGRYLALPPEQRTFFRMTPWGDELAWVEQVPPGSRIAFTETAFPYLLFGPRLQNKVYRLIATSEEEMLRRLRENDSQYFFTRTTTAYHRWAQQRSRVFQPVFTYDDYIVYRVRPSPPPVGVNKKEKGITHFSLRLVMPFIIPGWPPG